LKVFLLFAHFVRRSNEMAEFVSDYLVKRLSPVFWRHVYMIKAT